MELQEQIEINGQVDALWNVIAEQFGDVHLWRTDVNHSFTAGKPKLMGLSYSERVLQTNVGEYREVLTSFDVNQRSISCRRKDGLPFYIRKVSSIWSLTKAVNGAALVTVNQTIDARMLLGFILPFVKFKYRKQLKQELNDLKTMLERL